MTDASVGNQSATPSVSITNSTAAPVSSAPATNPVPTPVPIPSPISKPATSSAPAPPVASAPSPSALARPPSASTSVNPSKPAPIPAPHSSAPHLPDNSLPSTPAKPFARLSARPAKPSGQPALRSPLKDPPNPPRPNQPSTPKAKDVSDVANGTSAPDFVKLNKAHLQTSTSQDSSRQSTSTIDDKSLFPSSQITVLPQSRKVTPTQNPSTSSTPVAVQPTRKTEESTIVVQPLPSRMHDPPTNRPPQPHFTVPVDDDPVRRYLNLFAYNDSAPKLPKKQVEEWVELAWHRIPLTIQQAFDSFDMVRLPRGDITHCLFTLNLKSHTILRVDIQRKILAIKLVQRQISLLAVVECKNDVDQKNPSLATEQHRLIRSLPATSVWRNPSVRRDSIPDDIPWTSGDIPEFDADGNVIPGNPLLPPLGSLPLREDRPIRHKGSRSKLGRTQAARRKRDSNVNSNTPTVLGPAPGPASATDSVSGPVSGPAKTSTPGPSRASAPPISTALTPSSARSAPSYPGAGRSSSKDGISVDVPRLQHKRPTGMRTQATRAASQRDESAGKLSRDDGFDQSDYCRLLHVLCDERMRKALDALSQPVTNYDPWGDDIAPLFNDPKFAPAPIAKCPDGVQRSDIAGLTPQHFRRARSGTALALKFAEFKQLYIVAARNYVRFGRRDVSFAKFAHGIAYLTYAFCLLGIYSHLEPMILRNNIRADGPPVKKRRVSGDLETVDAMPDSDNSQRQSSALIAKSSGSNGGTMQFTGTTQRDNRIDRLHSTLAEHDKTVFETEEARVRMVTAILVAIREARTFVNEPKSSEYRPVCETLLRQLHAELNQQVNFQPYR